MLTLKDSTDTFRMSVKRNHLRLNETIDTLFLALQVLIGIRTVLQVQENISQNVFIVP